MTSFRQWLGRQFREARQRIREAQSTGAQRLELNDLELTTLPAGIGLLTNLHELNLAHNQLTTLPAEISQLTDLRELNLAHNQLTTLPAEISQLTTVHPLRLPHNQPSSPLPGIDRHTNLQELNLAHNQPTTRPTGIGQLTNLEVLNVAHNQLSALPDGIGRLVHLRELSAEDNELTRLPIEIGRIRNLYSLHLAHNQLTTVPSSLGVMTNLRVLDLLGNRLTALPPELRHLSNLQELNLGNNQLTTLPYQMRELINLHTLHLEGNRFPIPLPELVTQGTSAVGIYLCSVCDQLQSWEVRQRIREAQSSGAERLDLSGLGLSSLPAEIGQLTNLRQLDLAHNQLTALPAEIGQLTNLEDLDLAHNYLTALPPAIGRLTNLHTLRLAHNQLTTLPALIGRLTNLHTLRLRANRLTVLPSAMGRLTNLQALHLRGNQLTELPAEIGQLTDLHTLRIEGNPLQEPLPELVSQGTPAVLAYLRSLRDAETQYEAKLLLLGDPEAGKSSVVARLRSEGFDRDRSSTHGIELDVLHLPHPGLDGQAMITLHTWDFGGQPLYQATHQLFLTPQALYLLVSNPRQGASEQVDRWLRRIHLLVGDQARVVLVTTHADDRHRADFDFAALQQVYPTLLTEVVEIDNQSGYGIDRLSEVIAKQAARLPQMGEEVSRRWTAARDELLARHEPQLDRAACVAVCAEHGLDAAEAEALLGLLHVRGQVLWYADDPGLRELVVLQPEWLTKAISYVLEDRTTADAGGVLDHARLREIWPHRTDAPAYPTEYHPYLLQLMERFDVSYRLDPPDASLVGYLVPRTRRPLPWGLTDPPARGMRSLSVHCRLADEAAGLIAWLTVRNHRFTTGRHWRNGVFLALPGEFASEGLLELVNDRELAVKVHAPAPEHFFHVLLDSVRELILQRWPGLRYELEVPCAHRSRGHPPCQGRITLTALQRLSAEGKTEATCPTCGAAHDVNRLLTGYPGRVTAGPVSSAELYARFDDFEEGVEERLDRIQYTGQQTLEAVATVAGLTRVVLKLWTSHYEAADGCPRLYTLTPVDPKWISKAAFWQRPFLLTLWCEHDQRPHPWPKAYYEFTCDKQWWVAVSPHAQMVVRILRHILHVATPVLTLAASAVDLNVGQAQADLDAMGYVLDQLQREQPDELAGPDHTAEPAVASGVGLRALRALLSDRDPNRNFGGMRVVQTAANDLLWVCPNHYPIYVPPRPVLPAGESARLSE